MTTEKKRTWEQWAEATAFCLRKSYFCRMATDWHFGGMPTELDGNLENDGFSLDDAHEKWKAGYSPLSYYDLVIDRRKGDS